MQISWCWPHLVSISFACSNNTCLLLLGAHKTSRQKWRIFNYSTILVDGGVWQGGSMEISYTDVIQMDLFYVFFVMLELFITDVKTEVEIQKHTKSEYCIICHL